MAVALLGSVLGAHAGGSPATAALTGGINNGDLLIAVLVNSTATAYTAITQTVGTSAGVTWTRQAHAVAGSTVATELWWGVATATVSGSCTFSAVASSATGLQMGVMRWGGLKASPLDNSNSIVNAASTSIPSPVVTQAAVGDLIVMLGDQEFNVLGSPTNGFTDQWGYSNGGAAAYLVTSDSASHSTTWTSPSSSVSCAVGASFFAIPTVTPLRGRQGMTQAVHRAAHYMESAKGLLVPERRRFWSPQLVLAR